MTSTVVPLAGARRRATIARVRFTLLMRRDSLELGIMLKTFRW